MIERRHNSRVCDVARAQFWNRKRADAQDLESRLASGALKEGGR